MREIGPSEFLESGSTVPVIDVRAPAEYLHGHIPGAVNVPLFDDDERALVGTTYKQKSRSESIDLGLDIVGPKMSGFVKLARELASRKRILVHCWRGGMRSASMGWLLETAGFQVSVLKGGYKAYRSYIRENLVTGRKFIILGGLTGSGKTRWLNELKASGEPVCDLEALASHRGSVFGGIGLGNQPTNEQFENNLYALLRSFRQGDVIWLEDESRLIGNVYLPDPLYSAMIASPLIRIEVPEELRVQIIIDEYAPLSREKLADGIRKISRRLGGLVTQQSLELLANGDYPAVVRLILPYYDKTYAYSLQARQAQEVVPLDLTGIPVDEYRIRLIEKKIGINTINNNSSTLGIID
ncbi:MAG: tRNA 2-selenouridine(34) synthase MnmH [Bacteroidota bacterium]